MRSFLRITTSIRLEIWIQEKNVEKNIIRHICDYSYRWCWRTTAFYHIASTGVSFCISYILFKSRFIVHSTYKHIPKSHFCQIKSIIWMKHVWLEIYRFIFLADKKMFSPWIHSIIISYRCLSKSMLLTISIRFIRDHKNMVIVHTNHRWWRREGERKGSELRSH